MIILWYQKKDGQFYHRKYKDLADAMRVFTGNYHLKHYLDGIIEVYNSDYSLFPAERYFFDKYYARWERQ